MTAAEEQAGRPRGHHRLLLSAPLLLLVVVRAEHLGVREGRCVEQELVGAAWSWWRPSPSIVPVRVAALAMTVTEVEFLK